MKKPVRTFLCLTALLILTAAFFSPPPAAFAASGAEMEPALETLPEIVDETFTLIDDDTMDNKGWLTLRASVPTGFVGAIYAEVRNKSTGTRETIELSALTGYYDGQWLRTGTYTVLRTYVLDSDYFSVTCDTADFVVTNEEDAVLRFTVESNGQMEQELEQIRSTFVPNIPQETAPETIETTPVPETSATPTAPATEAAVPVTVSQDQEVSTFSSRLVMDLLAAVIFIGIVFLIAHLVRHFRAQ